MADNNPNNFIFIPFDVLVASPLIAANGSGITPITLDQDADFELHYIMGNSSADDSTKFFQNNFTCQITDKSNSRIWSTDRVPQVILCGPWNQSIMERRPVLLARKTNISFDILNLTAAPIQVNIILRGFKVRTP